MFLHVEMLRRSLQLMPAATIPQLAKSSSDAETVRMFLACWIHCVHPARSEATEIDGQARYASLAFAACTGASVQPGFARRQVEGSIRSMISALPASVECRGLSATCSQEKTRNHTKSPFGTT